MSKKIYYTFVVTAIILIGLIFVGIYDLVYTSTIKSEEQKIQAYIYNIAQYSAEIVDKSFLKIISDKIDPDMTDAEKNIVTNSREYNDIQEHLRLVKNHFSDYVSYIYIITPKEDSTYFVVAGHKTFTEIDQYGSVFDISPFEYLQIAYHEQKPFVEPHATYDPDYKLYSISAYSPLFVDGKFYGLLGVDLELKSYNRLRYSYSFIAFIISAFGLTCMVMTTLYISEKVSIVSSVSKRKKSR
jgi:hypothetical protein